MSINKLALFAITTSLVAVAARDAYAECHDLTVGGETFQQFCERNGYSYTYEKRNIDWDVSGPAKVTQNYTPNVMKTDTLEVNACMTAPAVTASDTHNVTYTKTDAIAVAFEVGVGVEVTAKVNTLMLGELGIKGSVNFKGGRTTTSTESEQASYAHTLNVPGCNHSKSDWKVIGMHNAKVEVPLTFKEQFRYYCDGYIFNTDWSPWYTCATRNQIAKGNSGHGCLSKAVTTSSDVTSITCPNVHPQCRPTPTPTPTTPTPTPTGSPTPTPSPSQSPSPSPSQTPTPSPSPSQSPTPTPTGTPGH